jgi:hypothetical protein
MPVVIHEKIKKQAPLRKGRGGGFDSAVKKRAPFIRLVQAEGCRDIRQLVEKLNEAGLTAPSGRPFSYGTLRRVLLRMKALDLGPGTRTKEEVAKLPRPTRKTGFVKSAK